MAKKQSTNTLSMLRAIINGQSAMKEELLRKMNKLDEKLTYRIDGLETKIDIGFENVNKRLDSIGSSVAYLEDDTPTREEHDNLERRVSKIEKKLATT